MGRGAGKGATSTSLAGVWIRTFSTSSRAPAGAPTTPARRPRWGPGLGAPGRGWERAASRSRGRRAAGRGGDGEAAAEAEAGRGATGRGRGWRRRRQRWRKRRSRRRAVERRRDPRCCRDPAAPGGRSRPQRTKEHAGAEGGPSSGRHEAPGAAGPRDPGRRRAPLGQRCPPARSPGPGLQHGAARAPAGPPSSSSYSSSAAAAAAAADRAAGAAGRRPRRRGAAPGLQARRAAASGQPGAGGRRGQGGVQQPGARAGPAPGHAAQPHGHPVSSPAPRPALPCFLLSARSLGAGTCPHRAPLCGRSCSGGAPGQRARPGHRSGGEAGASAPASEPASGPAKFAKSKFSGSPARPVRLGRSGPVAVPREDASKHAAGRVAAHSSWARASRKPRWIPRASPLLCAQVTLRY